MKLSLVLSLLTAPGAVTAYQPVRIPFQSLLEDDFAAGGGSTSALLSRALSSSGVVSITGLPNNFRSFRDNSFAALNDCLDQSNAAQEFTFADGTRRRTLATHSVPGAGIQSIQHQEHGADNDNKACDAFDDAMVDFRSTVAQATQAFADRLAEYISPANNQEKPLLATASGFPFRSFADVVENGEHLEHFHSYAKPLKGDGDYVSKGHTVEMHLDQGLFIAFTPGRTVTGARTSELTDGFFVQMQDGFVEEVQFNQGDDLVFMLGDGVNQYINDKLDGNKKLRAVPHMLRFQQNDEVRVWYGRMVLPPRDAVHPAFGVTFGLLREEMIAASHSSDENKHGLGCSGGMVARDLSATTCEGDSIYCWHRCMNVTEFQVSEDICQAQGLELHCINPRLQIWAGENHGDFYPACADAAVQEVETAFPTLPSYPRSDEICTDTAFEEFADSSGYSFSVDLGNGGRFMWSVEDGTVRGRIAYNGLFGWLAFGFADVDGLKNGMHGANVLMALPGGNYSAYSGLDLSLPSTLDFFEVHPDQSSFRYWMTPVATSRNGGIGASVELTECFTAMTFQESTIGSYTFNLEGSDELIWAANGLDYYVQYHQARGRFAIDWPTGELTLANQANSGEEEGTKDDESGAASMSFLMVASIAAIALFF